MLIINKLGRFPTTSDNVYFVNNEQTLLPVFTVVVCFTYVEHSLIKL